MGLFESVQLELFEFMGFKKPHNAQKINTEKAQKESTPKPQSFEELPYPVSITRKSHLRGLRFHVSLKGVLEVSASKSTKESDIFKLLEPHQAWIREQISKSAKHREISPQKKWQSGENFFFNGRDYRLIFSPSSTKKAHIRFMENSFEYFVPLDWQRLPQEDYQQKLHSKFLDFFKLRATEELNKKVSHWSKEMSAFPKQVSYRNQKSRWGSCSSDGKISLNWKLIAFDEDVQNYVIIHELAHLTHQNHSKDFWALVETFCPNRKAITQKLQSQALKTDCYASQSELYEHNPTLVNAGI